MNSVWPMPTSSYDAVTTHPGYPVWPGIAPLPNEPMMYHVGAPSVENFLVVADVWSQLVSRELTPGARVLDIGCGCGRTARLLLHHPYIRSYVGFDVIKPYVEWCTRFLTPLTQDRFQFQHLDVRSDHYNPLGTLSADDVRFPFAEGSFSLAFASVALVMIATTRLSKTFVARWGTAGSLKRGMGLIALAAYLGGRLVYEQAVGVEVKL